ncbi:MAG: cyclase family protein [Acidobacteria bacterium]|nr:cyclase family protein [Acidobacteriota bacterium]MCA1608825.1 cyclase family protein [Acidobacteriota bacterium]
MKIAAAVLFCITVTACTQRGLAEFPLGQWIDLSHEFSDETIYWVTAEPFKRATVAEGQTEKGYYYSAYNFSGAEHGGTHLDSPIHFAAGKKTVEQITVDQLIGTGVKIDVSARANADRDYLISVDDIKNWETANGKIPEWAIILFHTGFGSFWPDAKRYLGTDQKGNEAVKDLHFPGPDPGAAKWLVENRKIKAVGIDTASIDRGQSTDFGSHVALMTNNIPAFENVASLDRLPAKGFHVIALPMKIKGGSGAPLRIVAFLASSR